MTQLLDCCEELRTKAAEDPPKLAPAAHVDTSAKVLQYLAPHLPRVVLVHGSGPPPEGLPSSVGRTGSLAEYAETLSKGMAERGA